MAQNDMERRAELAADASAAIWTTRDGQKIPVDKMTTSHLINAGRMVYRKYRELAVELTAVYAYDKPTGDNAAFEWERADRTDWENVRACEFWLPVLTEELVRRGVKIDALKLGE